MAMMGNFFLAAIVVMAASDLCLAVDIDTIAKTYFQCVYEKSAENLQKRPEEYFGRNLKSHMTCVTYCLVKKLGLMNKNENGVDFDQMWDKVMKDQWNKKRHEPIERMSELSTCHYNECHDKFKYRSWAAPTDAHKCEAVHDQWECAVTSLIDISDDCIKQVYGDNWKEIRQKIGYA